MKSKLILSSLVIGALFSSCKKEETTPDPGTGGGTPTTTYLISTDSTTDGNVSNTQVRAFTFNSSKKVVKVKYKYGTSTTFDSYDTVSYNTSGQVSKVEQFNIGNSIASETNTYNYTTGQLTSVNESGTNSNGAYVRTRTFSYTSGKITAQTVVYTTGSGTGEPENITSIGYTGNNMTSASIDIGGTIYPVTVTYDLTAGNPYYGLNYDASDFINMFSQNNILKAYVTAIPTQIFADFSYTYTNGRVATYTDVAQTTPRTTYVSYQAL